MTSSKAVTITGPAFPFPSPNRHQRSFQNFRQSSSSVTFAGLPEWSLRVFLSTKYARDFFIRIAVFLPAFLERRPRTLSTRNKPVLRWEGRKQSTASCEQYRRRLARGPRLSTQIRECLHGRNTVFAKTRLIGGGGGGKNYDKRLGTTAAAAIGPIEPSVSSPGGAIAAVA